MTEDDATRLRRQLVKLKVLEKEIWEKDKYVGYIVKKYRPFQFNLKLFLDDAELARAAFSENVIVPAGKYAGRAFWGHHLPAQYTFLPHGFCIMIDRKRRVLQMGTFKDGKEFGQQRVVKSAPESRRDQQSFMQYTAVNDVMQGPALRETADGTVEVGVYNKNKRHGAWRTRNPDNSINTVVFENGSVKK